MALGDRLRAVRENRELSQGQLAKKIGVNSSTVALYESGDRRPSLLVLVKLSSTLGVTTDYLLGVADQKEDFINVSGLTAAQIQSINLIIDNYRGQMNR